MKRYPFGWRHEEAGARVGEELMQASVAVEQGPTFLPDSYRGSKTSFTIPTTNTGCQLNLDYRLVFQTRPCALVESTLCSCFQV